MSTPTVRKKSDYSDKLKDPRWQRKRLEIYKRDNWLCQRCFSEKNTLHVHHRRYIPNTEPWNYPNDLLVTLCEHCHEVERMELQEYSYQLLEILHDKFLGYHLGIIADGMHKLELQHLPDVVASAYSFAFSNPEIQSEIIDKYLNSLRKCEE